MKDRWFGDNNDYFKYGLLRILTGARNREEENASKVPDILSLTVCWMLTSGDEKKENRTAYLNRRGKQIRFYDPALFDWLILHLIENNEQPSISLIENSDLLLEARFFSRKMSSRSVGRSDYFERLGKLAKDCDLIFFDPDTGLDAPIGQDAAEYLELSELAEFFGSGHSVLCYQHSQRRTHEQFIVQPSKRILQRLECQEVYAFEVSTVAFFLAPQKRHASFVQKQIERFEDSFHAGGVKITKTDQHGTTVIKLRDQMTKLLELL